MAVKYFCAYPGIPSAIGDVYSAVKSRFGARANEFHLWRENDVCGRPLTDPIFEAIDGCQVLVADITRLNFNVTFEIGYAIGKGKPCLLFINTGLVNDSGDFSSIGIFDTIGYESYENSEDLYQVLSSLSERMPLNIDYPKNIKAPIYILETPQKSEAMTRITSQTKKTRIRYRSYNVEENVRLSANEAILNVVASFGVITPILSAVSQHHKHHNIRSAFVSGLSLGMGIPTLILQDYDGPAPLDVRDIVKTYKYPGDINDHINDLALAVTDALQATDPIPKSEITPLVQLSIGDPMAENEFGTLGRYFIETDAFRRALRGEANLVVGRKGMGKTALFSQIRDHIRENKKNIVVDLKPEGYQLVRLKEEILEFLSAGSQEYLITAFWEYILLLEVCYKLLEKDKGVYFRDHTIHNLYQRLEELYLTDKTLSEGDFSERLLRLSETIVSQFRADNPNPKKDSRLQSTNLTQLLYRHDIPQIRSNVSEYLEHKDSVWILFDNLDRGWPSRGPDKTDLLILRCLVEAGRKLQRSLVKDSHDCVVIVFIRNDVFELLMDEIPDFGKEMRVSLDWKDGVLLRELMRRRLSNSDSQHAHEFEKLWSAICVSHVEAEDSFDYLLRKSIMRPRNLLKLFLHSTANAANHRRSKISAEDIQVGLKHYSYDILIEASREIGDIVPVARQVLYKFVGGAQYYSADDLVSLIGQGVPESADVNKVVELLLYFGFLGITTNDVDKLFIYDVNYDMKLLVARIEKNRDSVLYVLHEAFWPALEIVS